MIKKLLAIVIASFASASLALASIVTLTVAWFASPSVLTEDENYLDGTVGLRNYFFSGDGSEDKPFEIVSPIHFYNLTRLQNLGLFSSTKYFQVGHYFENIDHDNDPATPNQNALCCISDYDSFGDPIYADYLDMESFCEENFVLPIGGEGTPFVGHFDGMGVPIKNLTVSGYPEDIGVFGYIAHEGDVRGLVCSNLTIKSLGYNSSVVAKDNMLFSEDIDDIFESASYLNTAYAQFFKYNGSTYVNVSGEDGNLKHKNGLSPTALEDINDEDNMIIVSRNPETNDPESWYYNGYFTYTEPTYDGVGDDPFTYTWKSSSPLIHLSEIEVNNEKRIVIDLTPLYESPSFNSGEEMQVDARFSLIASVEVDGYVFSRVIQSYTVEFYSNGHTWDDSASDKFYDATIYCDYVGETTESDINTNYHHGNNIGFLAGHVDGTMENCYVYEGSFEFNGSGAGYTKIPTETDSGLIGEIGTNVKNNIDADLGLVVNGDTGIMNFSRIYSLIRNDMGRTSYTNKGNVGNMAALPHHTMDGDYYKLTNVQQSFYLIRKNGEWHGGIIPWQSSSKYYNTYNPLNPETGVRDSLTNRDSVSYDGGYIVHGNGPSPRDTPPDNSCWRVKNTFSVLPELYIVWDSENNRWEPNFELEWDPDYPNTGNKTNNGAGVKGAWKYTTQPGSGTSLGEISQGGVAEDKNKDTSFIYNDSAHTPISNTAVNVGDCYYVTSESKYYSWNGASWDTLNELPDNAYKGGYDSYKGLNYYCYSKFVNDETIDLFSDYLRYYKIEDGEKQYIAKTSNTVGSGADPLWHDADLPNVIPADHNKVDFLWNRVIQDERGKDRGLGVFKVVTSYNSAAIDGPYDSHRLDNMDDCIIENNSPKTKVYFSTAEYDHELGGSDTAWNGGNPFRGSTLPSYSDVNSFNWPFSRDYNYCFELDLSEMGSSGGKDYMWNTNSEFLSNYLSSKLIDKYGVPVTPGTSRFGFMFRSSENELMDSLSSYMPVGKPSNKSKFTSYYQWDDAEKEWLSSDTEPETGTYKDTLTDVINLPNSSDDGDWYEVTAYYPSNSIVFSIANRNGANVSVVGKGANITVYGYDPSSSANDITPLYSMKSSPDTETDAHKYFTYSMETGDTGTETVQNGNSMSDSGCLYGHIFKLEQGTYVLGSNTNTKAQIYFLGVQGQTDGTIGATMEATVGKGVKNVEFLLEEPSLGDYDEETGIVGSKVASSSFKGLFNVESGTFRVAVVTEEDKKYLKLSYDNGGTPFVTYLLTYITDPSRKLYVNSELISGESQKIVG